MSKEEKQLKEGLVLLPTGKPHVSFSELRDWVECSWRHKLKHIDGIDLDDRGPALDFGTAVHAACERYVMTRELNAAIAVDGIKKAWKKYGYDNEKEYIAQAEAIIAEVPTFLDSTFPGWKVITAEHKLYERVDGHEQAFKGFIDAVIEAPGKRSKQLIWLLDWKTTSWGWSREKKSDELTRAQLILYKYFWCQEFNIEDPRDVRCAFVLLKRTANDGQRCGLVTVSVGDKTTARTMKKVNNMLRGMKKGLALKNRFSCRYCPYNNTPHCT